MSEIVTVRVQKQTQNNCLCYKKRLKLRTREMKTTLKRTIED